VENNKRTKLVEERGGSLFSDTPIIPAFASYISGWLGGYLIPIRKRSLTSKREKLRLSDSPTEPVHFQTDQTHYG
jgi:hypothetical protein